MYQRLKFHLRHLLRRRQEERDLEEEIRAHLAIAEQEHLDRGESPGQAKQSARRELGSEVLIKEFTRQMWGWTTVEKFAQNLQYVGRQMRRSPGFTAIAVLTLALGLGATTAMFSIVNGVLLRPLAYRDPARLYLVQNAPPPRIQGMENWPVNARHFHEWRTACHSCEQIALVEGLGFTLTGGGEPERLPGLRVSYNFFRTLGVQPALGRDFLPEEELPGRFHEVILADSLWRSRYASDPGVIGRVIQIDGQSHTIAGVMPPDLRLPVGGQWGFAYFAHSLTPLIFRPLGMDVSQARGAGMLNYASVVRLKPGVHASQALSEMKAAIAEFVREFKIELTPTLVPMQDAVTRGARTYLWLLLSVVGAVLLIACFNIGNLMLVRTSGRHREAGVRMALGASRAELFGLVLTEALVLVVIGGGLGLLLAEVAIKLFVTAAPIELPRLNEVHIDWRVLAFAGAVSGLSILICGLFPAWRLARIEPLTSIRSGSSSITESGRRLRLREILVGVEVALSTVLLIVGGLLAFSFFRLMRVDKGFETAHVITQDVSLINAKYGETARTRLIADLLGKLAGIPGVQTVGMTNQIPLRGFTWIDELRDPDQLPSKQEDPVLANFRFVSPEYFKALGVPLKQGRSFQEFDRNRKVAIVSERAARLLWPNQNPIGKHVGLTAGEQSAGEVIGVAGEVRAVLEQEAPLTVYQPYWSISLGGPSFVLRTQADPAAVISAIRGVLRSIDPDLPIFQPRTMEQILDKSVAVRRFETNLAVLFAFAALVLASLGIYGVISFTVARRTPEIGIRIALGARPSQLVAMVLQQGMFPVLAGFAAGLACALSIGRFLSSELFGVTPYDPVTIFAVGFVLIAVSVCACLIPARRATRVDPMRALRFE